MHLFHLLSYLYFTPCFVASQDKNATLCNNVIGDNVIGKIIKYARKSANLTQDELEKLANINRTTLENYETEFRQPTFEMIETLLNKCGVKIYFKNLKTGQTFDSKDVIRKDI